MINMIIGKTKTMVDDKKTLVDIAGVRRSTKYGIIVTKSDF